jgi:serine/threonine protein kinase
VALAKFSRYAHPFGHTCWLTSVQMRNRNTGIVFARKVLQVRKDSQAILRKEILLMENLCKSGHPNIVQLLENDSSQNNDNLYLHIDMELCQATLAEYLDGDMTIHGLTAWKDLQDLQYREAKIRQSHIILQHILNGLVYIHSLEKVHRDLKPQNSRNRPHSHFINTFSTLQGP